MCKVRCLKSVHHHVQGQMFELVHHVQGQMFEVSASCAKGHARPGATARLAALEMKHTQVT